MLTFDYPEYMQDAVEVRVREKAIHVCREVFTKLRQELQGDHTRLAELRAQQGQLNPDVSYDWLREDFAHKIQTLQQELDGREAWLTKHEADLQVEVEKLQAIKQTVNERRQWLLNCGQPDPAEKITVIEKTEQE